jgi:hypothetical protein
MTTPVRTPGTLGLMPTEPWIQHRSVRIEDDVWNPAEEATAEMDTDRAKVINQFLAWYLRTPGAKLPGRPEPRTTEEWLARRDARKAARAARK